MLRFLTNICDTKRKKIHFQSEVALHLFGLTGLTSQFLNGTHEFSELVLARMVLLMDESRSVLPLRSAKAREFGELWREKCTRAPWTFPFKLARTSSFRPVRMDNHLRYNRLKIQSNNDGAITKP